MLYKEEGTAERDDRMASEPCFCAAARAKATATTAHSQLIKINYRLTINLTIKIQTYSIIAANKSSLLFM